MPNTRVEAAIKNTHMPVWFWRAPGANQHVFALESFLDEIASAGGLDPYQVRRKLLEGKPDWLKVLDTAAEKGDWGKPLPKGRGRGIAICEDTDSLCAQVAEVTVRPNGDVKVDRVTVALDTRYMVNPQTIAEQAEGGVIFGLSAALYGKIIGEERRPGARQFRHLPHGAPRGGAEDRCPSRPERRQGLGRRGRARNPADRRRGGERDLRRDRQAHSHAADHRQRSVLQVGLNKTPRRQCRRLLDRLLVGGKPAPKSAESTSLNGL